MSTNILLINGSPKGKKSNTYKLATAFIQGLKEECELIVEEIALGRYYHMVIPIILF